MTDVARPRGAAPPRVRVDVLLDADRLDADLLAEARAGLSGAPPALPPLWLYDDEGSDLFDRITELDEYYPTRAERRILQERASTIASLTKAGTLVELGSGTSTKTTLLLDALRHEGALRRFVPFDVSEPTLRRAASTLADRYPDLDVHAVVGDFTRHLGALPPGGPKLIAFLGSTIGNLDPSQRAAFFAHLARTLGADDALLLGTDLVKDVARLEAAYDDSLGVTAAFTANVLRRLNRELGADFALDAFEHVARWDPAHEWVDIGQRARTPQRVRIPSLDLVLELAAGDLLRFEVSTKFRRAGLEGELTAAGLRLDRWWTDPDGDFALSLVRRT